MMTMQEGNSHGDGYPLADPATDHQEDVMHRLVIKCVVVFNLFGACSHEPLSTTSLSGDEHRPGTDQPEKVELAELAGYTQQLNQLQTTVLPCAGDGVREVYSASRHFSICVPSLFSVTSTEQGEEMILNQALGELLRLTITYVRPVQSADADVERAGFALDPQLTLTVSRMSNADNPFLAVPGWTENTEVVKVGEREYYRFWSPGVVHEITYVTMVRDLVFVFTGKGFPTVYADAKMRQAVDAGFMMVLQTLKEE